jgi:hypothetical protein
MYLPLWSTATNNKWNLVNPLDTNGAFRLTFATGMTHGATGMTGNGTTGYADTFLIPSTHLTIANNFHFSFYSQTQVTESKYEMGAITTVQQTLALNENTTTKKSIIHGSYPTNWASTTSTNTRGFQIGTRLLSNDLRLHFNGSKIATNTSNWAGTYVGSKVFLCAINYSPNYASTKTCSFSSIGDGLTDTEATNFSNRVNTLLAYFGINTYPVVSDADAQAYINANEAITSQSDANAINTFFTGLKSDGIYTKIKAMYLPIWGSASSSKWNLVNPQDTDAAYRLTFATGMTFTSSGMTSNGTSGYALTHLIPNTYLTNNNTHLSIYSRTNSSGVYFDIGSGKPTGQYFDLALNITGNIYADQYNSSTGRITTSNANTQGFYISSRTLSNVFKLFKNSAQIGTTNTGASTGFTSINDKLAISALNEGGTLKYYTTRQYPFASIGDGLTDTEASNFSNRVNTLMTYFGINV